MVLNVILMVCWIVLLAQSSFWSALAIGTVLFVLILVGLVVYLIITIKEIRLTQRQANFIDSVTHELKSPIASLKLYLETLCLRDVSPEQRESFYDTMLDDLTRLDRLINRLLEVGQLDALVAEEGITDVQTEQLLRQCANAACSQHHQPPEVIELSVTPSIVRGDPLALEMVFRNLFDNAIKYGGDDPHVRVESICVGDRVITRIIDNGAGVPLEIRGKIFKLFFRGGSELERKQKGTGLGLYIVYTLVRKMRGKVSVLPPRANMPGAHFEVELPGRAIKQCAS